jgi:glycine dehydrogenase subunit 1
LGKSGLRKVAELCYHKAHYAANRLSALPGYELLSERPFFKEFPLRCPRPVSEINEYLLDEWGIVGGYDLERNYPHMANTMLVCVTEMNSKEEIDLLVEALSSMEEGA